MPVQLWSRLMKTSIGRARGLSRGAAVPRRAADVRSNVPWIALSSALSSFCKLNINSRDSLVAAFDRDTIAASNTRRSLLRGNLRPLIWLDPILESVRESTRTIHPSGHPFRNWRAYLRIFPMGRGAPERSYRQFTATGLSYPHYRGQRLAA
jgi:hypothetical protein